MKKKMFCTLLVFCIMLGNIGIVFATDTTNAEQENIIRSDEAALLGLNKTAFSGIMEADNGSFYRQVAGNFILQECQAIPFASSSAVDAILGDEELPLEIRESIQRRYENACSLGQENEVTVTIFSDAPKATRAAGDTTYVTVNGYDCKNYQVQFTNLSSGYQDVKTGTSAATWAEQITNVALSFDSDSDHLAVAMLGWASTAKTVLDVFLALSPMTYVNGSTEDFIQFSMTYNCTDQYTYVWSTFYNDWSLGLFSQSVTMTKANLLQYYYNPATRTGDEQIISLIGSGLNRSYKSPDFDDPYETAIAFRNVGAYDWVTASWGNMILSFTG